MLKMKGKVYAKEGLTMEEFKTRWLNVVMPKARQLPGLKKYVINIVVGANGEEPGYQGTVELWWDNLKAMQEALATPLGKEVETLVNTLTRKVTSIITEEYVII